VSLEPAQALEELGVDLRHPPSQAVEVLGVPNPCHHVLPLRVDEEVAIRPRVSIGRVPRERNPGS
jgi:hypothetical protein